MINRSFVAMMMVTTMFTGLLNPLPVAAKESDDTLPLDINYEIESEVEPVTEPEQVVENLEICDDSNEEVFEHKISENSIYGYDISESELNVKPIIRDGRNREADVWLSETASSNIPDYEDLPNLRNQGKFGTCWAHAASLVSEMSMVKNGMAEDVKAIDLSELHLAYYTYNPAADPLGGFEGDGVTLAGPDSLLNYGGNIKKAMLTYASWTGPANEKVLPYDRASELDSIGLEDAEAAYLAHKNKAYLTTFRMVDLNEDRDIAKSYIRDKGAISISYYEYGKDDPVYYNSDNNSYYCYDTQESTNHGITVVGWDDNFSRDNFGSIKPEGDGAWLARNSWSTKTSTMDWSHSGYFWLSYYDKGLASAAGTFEFTSTDKYDNNYQYDGCLRDSTIHFSSDGIGWFQGGNRFTINACEEGEKLEAISFYVDDVSENYTVKVYKNCDLEAMDEGTLVAQENGSITCAGLYTVPISTPVYLDEGDDVFVSLRLETSDGRNPSIVCERSLNVTEPDGSVTKYKAGIKSGQSYYFNGASWVDLAGTGYGNIRLKAYTSNCAEKIPVPDISVGIVRDSNYKDGYFAINSGVEKNLSLSVFADNEDYNPEDIEWSVDDETIASIEGNGLTATIRGLKPGVGYIRAKLGAATDSIKVIVFPGVVNVEVTSDDDNKAIVSWKGTNEVDVYKLYRYYNGESQLIATIDSTVEDQAGESCDYCYEDTELETEFSDETPKYKVVNYSVAPLKRVPGNNLTGSTVWSYTVLGTPYSISYVLGEHARANSAMPVKYRYGVGKDLAAPDVDPGYEFKYWYQDYEENGVQYRSIYERAYSSCNEDLELKARVELSDESVSATGTAKAVATATAKVAATATSVAATVEAMNAKATESASATEKVEATATSVSATGTSAAATTEAINAAATTEAINAAATESAFATEKAEATATSVSATGTSAAATTQAINTAATGTSAAATMEAEATGTSAAATTEAIKVSATGTSAAATTEAINAAATGTSAAATTEAINAAATGTSAAATTEAKNAAATGTSVAATTEAINTAATGTSAAATREAEATATSVSATGTSAAATTQAINTTATGTSAAATREAEAKEKAEATATSVSATGTSAAATTQAINTAATGTSAAATMEAEATATSVSATGTSAAATTEAINIAATGTSAAATMEAEATATSVSATGTSAAATTQAINTAATGTSAAATMEAEATGTSAAATTEAINVSATGTSAAATTQAINTAATGTSAAATREAAATATSVSATGTSAAATREAAATATSVSATGTSVAATGTSAAATSAAEAEAIQMAHDILELVNQARDEAGVGDLQWNSALLKAANVRVKEIVELQEHIRPNGTDALTAIDEAGYKGVITAENFAWGFGDAESVVNGWLGSIYGHRDNILKDAFADIGIACYKQDGTWYYVQCFGGTAKSIANAEATGTSAAATATAIAANGPEAAATATSASATVKSISATKRAETKATNAAATESAVATINAIATEKASATQYAQATATSASATEIAIATKKAEISATNAAATQYAQATQASATATAISAEATICAQATATSLSATIIAIATGGPEAAATATSVSATESSIAATVRAEATSIAATATQEAYAQATEMAVATEKAKATEIAQVQATSAAATLISQANATACAQATEKAEATESAMVTTATRNAQATATSAAATERAKATEGPGNPEQPGATLTPTEEAQATAASTSENKVHIPTGDKTYLEPIFVPEGYDYKDYAKTHEEAISAEQIDLQAKVVGKKNTGTEYAAVIEFNDLKAEYNGSKVTADRVILYRVENVDGGRKLTPLYKGSYGLKLTYKNNVKANVDENGQPIPGIKNQPSVTIKFTDPLLKKTDKAVTVNFDIYPANIEKAGIVLSKPIVELKTDKAILKNGNVKSVMISKAKVCKLNVKKDFSALQLIDSEGNVVAEDNGKFAGINITKAGRYKTKLIAKGNFYGEITTEEYVVKYK